MCSSDLKAPNLAKFESLPGYGIRGVVSGRKLLVGNRSLLRNEGVSLPSDLDRAMIEMEDQGKTAVIRVMDVDAAAVLGCAGNGWASGRHALLVAPATGKVHRFVGSPKGLTGGRLPSGLGALDQLAEVREGCLDQRLGSGDLD